MALEYPRDGGRRYVIADDVLVFTTKTQQLDVALQQWVDQPVHGPDGVVGTAGDLLPALTALNGVVAEEKALRYFRRVFGNCGWLPATRSRRGDRPVMARASDWARALFGRSTGRSAGIT
jgi:hypothetical protein